MKELLHVTCKGARISRRLHEAMLEELSIKASLSLNHLKTREIGGFKEERALRASAIRVDLTLAVEMPG